MFDGLEVGGVLAEFGGVAAEFLVEPLGPNLNIRHLPLV